MERFMQSLQVEREAIRLPFDIRIKSTKTPTRTGTSSSTSSAAPSTPRKPRGTTMVRSPPRSTMRHPGAAVSHATTKPTDSDVSSTSLFQAAVVTVVTSRFLAGIQTIEQKKLD
jgi:hypothetical protein